MVKKKREIRLRVWVVVLAILFWLLSFFAAYAFGVISAPLRAAEADCILNKTLKGEIFVSKDQALCLADAGLVNRGYGIGNPALTPDGNTRMKLSSSRMVIISGLDSEFEDQLEERGVYMIRK